MGVHGWGRVKVIVSNASCEVVSGAAVPRASVTLAAASPSYWPSPSYGLPGGFRNRDARRVCGFDELDPKQVQRWLPTNYNENVRLLANLRRCID